MRSGSAVTVTGFRMPCLRLLFSKRTRKNVAAHFILWCIKNISRHDWDLCLLWPHLATALESCLSICAMLKGANAAWVLNVLSSSIKLI